MNTKLRYEVRQIDAWAEAEGDWTWNESYHLFDFATRGNDIRRAFLAALKRNGITFHRGKIHVGYDGDIYEVRTRKDDCPIFAALPIDN